MSRSYKKTPYLGDKKNKFFKKYANRKIRRTSYQFKGNSYRKNFPQYDICDYIYLAPSFQTFCKLEIANWKEKQVFLAGTSWYKEEPCPTYEQLKKDYDKYYRRK